MNNIISSSNKSRRVAAAALAVAIAGFAASTASAAPTQGKRATWTKSTTTTAPAAAPAATTTSATTVPQTVTAIHAIGGYVFYNVSYVEAVELWFAAVAAAPAGYTPPPVYSVSATTTVSGTVTEGSR